MLLLFIQLPMLALTQLSNYLTLKGSFSAVSKPIFASKMRWKALAEIYKMHSFAPFSWNPSLSSMFCLKIAKNVANLLLNFKNCRNLKFR